MEIQGNNVYISYVAFFLFVVIGYYAIVGFKKPSSRKPETKTAPKSSKETTSSKNVTKSSNKTNKAKSQPAVTKKESTTKQTAAPTQGKNSSQTTSTPAKAESKEAAKKAADQAAKTSQPASASEKKANKKKSKAEETSSKPSEEPTQTQVAEKKKQKKKKTKAEKPLAPPEPDLLAATETAPDGNEDGFTVVSRTHKPVHKPQAPAVEESAWGQVPSSPSSAPTNSTTAAAMRAAALVAKRPIQSPTPAKIKKAVAASAPRVNPNAAAKIEIHTNTHGWNVAPVASDIATSDEPTPAESLGMPSAPIRAPTATLTSRGVPSDWAPPPKKMTAVEEENSTPDKKTAKVRTAFRTLTSTPHKTAGVKDSRGKRISRPRAGMVRGENNAVALGTTGSARVDLFFKAVRQIDPDMLEILLQASWKESALDTLKLIFQARDCRGGKGEKAMFYASLRWLGKNHPEVLAKCLKEIPFFGTWKDVLVLMDSPFEKQAISLFAQQLQSDLAELAKLGNTKEKLKVSLCAKWAPTENQGKDVDKAARKIAKALFPKSKVPLTDYRKKVIVPLRRYLRITEKFMCAGEWSIIPYSGVASRCMNRSRAAFTKHDGERFQKFLEDVAAGKTTIKGKQMYPHEIVKQYPGAVPVDQVLELQWKTIIEDVQKSGGLRDSLVLSDVSGSMDGTPMEVSIALGLLISEVTAEPFKNLVMTFETSPSLVEITGATLRDRVIALRQAPAGGSTDFQACMDLILNKALQFNLPAEQMPKRLYVISDMQFNQADHQWKEATHHEITRKKFTDAGYKMPQIVYWNVRANTVDFPTDATSSGVALVSGFSPSILKSLMGEGEINPVSVLEETLHNPRYDVLSV
eukprot:TRINITY_DN3450_c0_g2_i3.p1 TRINITY_DN3450_c0_g2~~TRINITY_DN3450_c0_g2_i3.p1  ORF type:complete len:876 (-),score=265.76 TRINITY_DN3450_c0_g2_i3:161-2746(-)